MKAAYRSLSAPATEWNNMFDMVFDTSQVGHLTAHSFDAEHFVAMQFGEGTVFLILA